MQKQQCNTENKLSTNDAFHDASFFEDALHPSATDSKFDVSSIGLPGRDTCLCVVICHTAEYQCRSTLYADTTAFSQYLCITIYLQLKYCYYHY